MRVALVQETVDVRRGGAETSTVEMARRLAELGLDVTLLYSAPSDTPFVEHNVTFSPIAARGFSRALRTYHFVQDARRICFAQRFDIVHAVTPCLAANVYQPRGGTYVETINRSLAMVTPVLWRALKRLGRRFNIRQRFLYRLEQLLLRKYADRVTVAAVSQYVGRQVTGGFGFPAARTRLIFNGVEIEPLTPEETEQHRTDLREQLGVNADAPLILFVAHNFKLKGLAELLRACAAPEPDTSSGWILAVAGRDRPDRYERLARELGLDPRVRFVGTETPIRHWYAAADVLAHPTWYDPCSRVVLEALSLGLPVVTTRCNGAAEIMEPGRHGEVVDSPDNPSALAAALTRTLLPAVRDACRDDAPALREYLSMARHARELKSLYDEIAGTPA